MMPAAGKNALLEFFTEPFLIVAPTGEVLEANSAAKRLTGEDPVGRDVSEFLASPEAEFRAWLRRCYGTTSPLVGSLTFRGSDGEDMRFRTYGARLRGAEEPPRIALRCAQAKRDAFSILKRELEEVNAENRLRQRNQAMLEETLADKEVLLRELHHRVKNNLQVMIGMFSAAQREAASEEVKDFLEAARQRLIAMGAAQQLVGESGNAESIPADVLVHRLCDAAGSAFGPDVEVTATAPDATLSSATASPVALILNELLTNAFKHGLGGGPGRIRVNLAARGRDFTLTVSDPGPGIPDGRAGRQSSGLGLVQGLCRQIGARLTTRNGNGGEVRIEFHDDAGRKEAAP